MCARALEHLDRRSKQSCEQAAFTCSEMPQEVVHEYIRDARSAAIPPQWQLMWRQREASIKRQRTQRPARRSQCPNLAANGFTGSTRELPVEKEGKAVLNGSGR